MKITTNFIYCTEIRHTDVGNFSSFMNAIDFARDGGYDLFIAVGGGSVMDTCKAANLYSADREAEFLDYVNAPIGKGLPVTVKLSPLIAGVFSVRMVFFK